MASTFFALLALADIKVPAAKFVAEKDPKINTIKGESVEMEAAKTQDTGHTRTRPSLHYNIQIHLPSTKDIEVFNAIFKSLKEHLID